MSYRDLKTEFQTIFKRILKTELSLNLETLIKHKIDLINQYNIIINYFATNFDDYNEEQKITATEEFNYIKNKLILCLERLHCNYTKEIKFLQPINISYTNDPIPDNIFEQTTKTDSEDSFLVTNTVEHTMAEEQKIAFAKLCHSSLGHSFKGDEQELDSFISSLEVLKELAAADQLDLLFKIAKSKLTSTAAQCLRSSDTTIDELIASLKLRIKPDSSDVISGRMTALRLDKISLTDFSKQAEILAQSFKRSLIVFRRIPREKSS